MRLMLHSICTAPSDESHSLPLTCAPFLPWQRDTPLHAQHFVHRPSASPVRSHPSGDHGVLQGLTLSYPSYLPACYDGMTERGPRAGDRATCPLVLGFNSFPAAAGTGHWTWSWACGCHAAASGLGSAAPHCEVGRPAGTGVHGHKRC
jgi:hypothetical protein